MPAGMTITGSLADSLDVVVASARIVREDEGNMSQLVDRVTLAEGTGLDWKEISMSQMVAQAITETTVLDNPQQVVDTAITIEPTVVGIQTRITKRVAARINKLSLAKIGSLGMNAMVRKKDEDGLTVLDGFTTSYPGNGSTTLTSGHISAAMAKITGNSTEPGKPPYRCVLHGYQLRDIEDEIVAGVGTYVVDEGLTARVFKEGFRGMIARAQLYEDGNISVASNQAKGGVFAMEAIVLVQGAASSAVTKDRPEIGGGATDIYHYDEYAYGERQGAWGVEIFSDATVPSS